MRFFSGFSIALTGLSLAACVTLPHFKSDVLTPNDIVQNLRCQLADAILDEPDPHTWLMPFKASFVITLKVLKSNNSTGDATLAIPLNPGVATPKIALGFKTQATRTIDFKVNDKIERLVKSPLCRERLVLLEGDLGIRGYLDRIRPIAKGLSSVRQLANSNYSLEFLIDKSLTPSSAFSMIAVNSKMLGANVNVALQAQFTHRLQLTITPPDAPKKKKEPLEVVVVRDDSQGVLDLVDQIKDNQAQLRELNQLRTQKEEERLAPKFAEESSEVKELRDKQIRRLNDQIDQLQIFNKSLTRQINRPKYRTRTVESAPEISPSEDQRLRDGQTRALIDSLESKIDNLQVNP